MADEKHTFKFDPTMNVDVGGQTVWSIGGPEVGEWSWHCDQPDILTLEPSGHNNTQCTIQGTAGGQGNVWAQTRDGSHRLSQPISVGLIFVWGADGNLYAATTSSFKLMTRAEEFVLTKTIPTPEQMGLRSAYYVPPSETDSVTNVTCFVINLEQIKKHDVWPPSPPSVKKPDGQ